MYDKARILLVTLSVIVVSACSTTTTGNPSAPTGATGPKDVMDQLGVPRVQNPLDARNYEKDPCGLVPKDLVARLGYLEPGKVTDENTNDPIAGPQCGWVGPPEKQGTIAVLVATTNRKNAHGGLTDYYSTQSSVHFYGYFEATRIDGYPALYIDIDDNRSRGDCSLAVGIADNLSIRVAALSYPSGEENQSCNDVRTLTSSIIEKLKGSR